MKTPAFILTENSLTVSVEGKTYTINSGHPSWRQAIESLKRKDYQALKDLVSVKKAFSAFTGDKVKVIDVACGDRTVEFVPPSGALFGWSCV